MFFNRKQKKSMETCNHNWILSDYTYETFNAGVSVDVEDRYILYCDKCNSKNNVDEFTFYKMNRLGLIKEC